MAPVLVSVHDVMPETRAAVSSLLTVLDGLPAEAVTLLVVPGRDWSDDDLSWLRDLAARGYPLAGHGWRHRCDPPRSFYHRAHSALLSRDVAEHLSLDSDGVAALIRDCHDWFARHQVPVADLYVPPAWALGPLARAGKADLPFRYIETLTGIHDLREDRFRLLPLLGYEADTPGRARVLRLCNAVNRGLAAVTGTPLRLSVHPFDLDYHLRRDLLADIARVERPLAYDASVWSR